MSMDPISDNERLVDAINTHRETLQETNSILLAIARTLVFIMEDTGELNKDNIPTYVDDRYIGRRKAVTRDLNLSGI